MTDLAALARRLTFDGYVTGNAHHEACQEAATLLRALAKADAAMPDFAERHVQLGKFYAATDTDDLIDKMEQHIARLQEKVAALTPKFSFAPQIVREG